MNSKRDVQSADVVYYSYPMGDTSKKEYFERRMAPHVIARITRKLKQRYGINAFMTTDSQEFSNDLSGNAIIGTIHAPAGLLPAIANDITLERYHIFSIKIKLQQ